jgi:hypothetical protein
MGKRSDFPRHPRDDYSTPVEALEPLIRFLDKSRVIIEPCPGAGKLVKHMREAGYCVLSVEKDAREYQYFTIAGDDNRSIFVTNPPWTREVLHPIIVNLSDQAPTWLLLDADWMHLASARPFLSRLRVIVSVGRVQWFSGSPSAGKDNSAWYRFERPSRRVTRFHGRA